MIEEGSTSTPKPTQTDLDISGLFDLLGKYKDIQKKNAEIKAIQRAGKKSIEENKIQLENLQLNRNMGQMTFWIMILTIITVLCGLVQAIIGILSYLKN